MKPCRKCGAENRNASGNCRPCSAAANKRWQQRHYDAHREMARRWKDRNPEKQRALERSYVSRNPDKVRARMRRWKGLPDPSRPEPGACECCGGPSGSRAMSLDHCHTTGRFRGWLCSNCNTAIGKLGDTIEGVMRAVSYLERAA